MCWPSRVSMSGPAKEDDVLQVVWRQLRQCRISLFSLCAPHLKPVCVRRFTGVAEEVAAREGPCLQVLIQWIR